jgi:hypothetical protein
MSPTVKIKEWSVTPYKRGDMGAAPPESPTIVQRSERRVVVRGTVYGRNGCAELTWGTPELVNGTLKVTIGAGSTGQLAQTRRTVGTQTPRRACSHVIKALPYEFRALFSGPFRGTINVTEGGYAFNPNQAPRMDTDNQ